MEKCHFKHNKRIKFIQLGEVAVRSEKLFALTNQLVRKNEGKLVDCLLLLAEVRVSTSIGG